MTIRARVLSKLANLMHPCIYLEIGVAQHGTFRVVPADKKVGVDPHVSGQDIVTTTSDEYFSKDFPDFNLVFIDGSHEYWQVLRDFGNVQHVVEGGGVVVLHDSNPQHYGHTKLGHHGTAIYNGDVWKAVVTLRTLFHDFHFTTVQEDSGVTVVTNDWISATPLIVPHDMDWNWFHANRQEVLNLVPFREWRAEWR